MPARPVTDRARDASRSQRSYAPARTPRLTAPIAASSGDTIRHRLNRGGNRQLNKVIHTAAKTQVRLPGPGRDYYQRRRGETKTNADAIRALKRHITTAIYRTLQADAAARAGSPCAGVGGGQRS